MASPGSRVCSAPDGTTPHSSRRARCEAARSRWRRESRNESGSRRRPDARSIRSASCRPKANTTRRDFSRSPIAARRSATPNARIRGRVSFQAKANAPRPTSCCAARRRVNPSSRSRREASGRPSGGRTIADLARLLVGEARIVVVGGEADRSLSDEIADATGGRSIDATGRLSLLASAEVIGRAGSW